MRSETRPIPMTEGSQRWTRMMKFEQNLEAARKQAQEEKEELQLQEEERQATYMEKIRKKFKKCSSGKKKSLLSF